MQFKEKERKLKLDCNLDKGHWNLNHWGYLSQKTNHWIFHQKRINLSYVNLPWGSMYLTEFGPSSIVNQAKLLPLSVTEDSHLFIKMVSIWIKKRVIQTTPCFIPVLNNLKENFSNIHMKLYAFMYGMYICVRIYLYIYRLKLKVKNVVILTWSHYCEFHNFSGVP